MINGGRNVGEHGRQLKAVIVASRNDADGQVGADLAHSFSSISKSNSRPRSLLPLSRFCLLSLRSLSPLAPSPPSRLSSLVCTISLCCSPRRCSSSALPHALHGLRVERRIVVLQLGSEHSAHAPHSPSQTTECRGKKERVCSPSTSILVPDYFITCPRLLVYLSLTTRKLVTDY
ncbi:hypothetical protein GY45DRAFT_648975 [Cubamyces sp. BRFM 1775]|nr:hypothetical protein GY45DRAFT_648975 [Cubamyces sp. BRFM 1775]